MFGTLLYNVHVPILTGFRVTRVSYMRQVHTRCQLLVCMESYGIPQSPRDLPHDICHWHPSCSLPKAQVHTAAVRDSPM